MAILRVTCPECDAALTSKTGFTAGKEITCPRCDAEFEVTAPKVASAKPVAKKSSAVDDDENDRPQKRKRSREEDEDDEDDRPRKRKKGSGGYKTSPLRFVVLGILVLVMLGLGVALIMKMMKDREDAKADSGSGDDGVAEVDNRRAVNSGLELKPLANPGSPAGGNPTPPAVNVQKCIDPKLTGAELETARKLGTVLVGKWIVPMSKNDDQYTIEYKADGTYTESRKKTGKSSSGKWLIVKATDPTLTLQRGSQTVMVNLKVQRTGAYNVEHTNTLPDDSEKDLALVPLIKQ